jgi:tetratricopeptide (TPR) repeat protein
MARQAERLFLKALKQEPDNAEILGAYADYLVNKAGREEEAAKYYRKAVDIDGGGPRSFSKHSKGRSRVSYRCAPTEACPITRDSSVCRQQEQPGGLRQVPQVSHQVDHSIV